MTWVSTADRLNGVEEYYFSRKLKEIAAMRAAGKDVYNLGIGSPDLPPHHTVIEALSKSAIDVRNHAYQSYQGLPELRQAFADWYQKYYRVNLDPSAEILPLLRSKEGIMHVSMAFLQAGDEVLIPNPGYPTYRSASGLTGATIVEYALKEANHWEPDWQALEAMDLSKVKLMWVNYPHMPTGANGSMELFEKIVAFGKRHKILICHDNPYSFILNDRPASLLEVPGAKEVVLELNSLSKSHNMAGWRMGMIAGSAEHLKEVIRFKSNMDSGMFKPLQVAAVSALKLGEDWFSSLNKVYAERRQKAFALLDLLECTYDPNQVGMFVWGRVPERYEDGYQLSDEALYNAHVFITPGGIFGSEGNAYIRISLCSDGAVLEEAVRRLMITA